MAESNVVVIETSLGTIKVELDPAKAPVTVKNFLAYVDEGFYDGTVFHRVIPNFMIQGGGMEPGHEAEEDQGGHQERVRQRPGEQARHDRHGPHQRGRTAPRRSSSSTSRTTASSTAPRPATASATVSSAR